MKFYEVLSEYYDEVFPFTENKAKFLEEEFEGRDPILDAACGSGTYSLYLARKGKNVTAIDLDEKMVELAKNKKESGDNIDIICEDMTKVKDLDKKYGGIFCIGNSIVHLNDKEAIKSFIHDCYDSLQDGGKFVMQIINYDKVLKEGLNGLPSIRRPEDGFTFHREYNIMDNGDVEFKGIIELVGGKEYVNSVKLVPLVKSDIEEYMSIFKNVKIYGGFGREDWDMRRLPVVVSGEK